MSDVSDEDATAIACRVEDFVRHVVAPYERDARLGAHGPSPELVAELRDKARAAGVMTPHRGPQYHNHRQHFGSSSLFGLACACHSRV